MPINSLLNQPQCRMQEEMRDTINSNDNIYMKLKKLGLKCLLSTVINRSDNDGFFSILR